MKQATRDVGFIKNEDGRTIGVSLGYDRVAEHEMGIMPLEYHFGLNRSRLGYEARKNTNVPYGLALEQVGNNTLFVYDGLGHTEESLVRLASDELRINPEIGLGAAWRNNKFGIAVSPEHSEVLGNLYEAFNSNNGVILLSHRGPSVFGGSGLNLMDFRLIPTDVRKESIKKDKAFRRKQRSRLKIAI